MNGSSDSAVDSAFAGSETGTETGGNQADPRTVGFKPNPTDTASTVETDQGTTQETSRDSVVQAVGNTGGVEKKRRGRPPGSKNTKSAKPIERTGWGVPCSREQAEASARVILSMTTPAYNGAFAFFERPSLLEQEKALQRDAIVEFEMVYGDILGAWGPILMLGIAFSSPAINRVLPPAMTGLDKEVKKEALENGVGSETRLAS